MAITQQSVINNNNNNNKNNPFKRDDHWSVYEIIKTALCTITLFPFRLLAVVLIVIVYYLIVRVATWRLKAFDGALSPARRKIINIGRVIGRLCLFSLGFWKVKVNGSNKLTYNGNHSNIYVVNHSSWIDILVLMATAETIPSFVAKKSVENIPIFGYDSKAWQCIYVDRLAHKEGAATLLKERACDFTKPPVVVFPEGTTSNGKYLIKFHTGAFLAGAPVKPVLIKYTCKHFRPTWESISATKHIFRLLTQFSNYVEVTFLPLYTPNEEEKNNAVLYANNVQKVMAQTSGVQTTVDSYKEKVEYLKSLRGEYKVD